MSGTASYKQIASKTPLSERLVTKGMTLYLKTAVILSGGLGTRLMPFTQAIPKPLLPVGEKAILEIQIERFVRFGFRQIYLATNYKSDYIGNFIGNGAKYGAQVHISREKKPLGTAGPLKLLKSNLCDPFLVMNGDILTLADLTRLYEFGCSVDAQMTVAIKKVVTPFDFGNIRFSGDYVAGIEEKPNITSFAVAGIYVVKPELLALIPDETYFGMDSLMLKMLKSGMKIAKYEINEYWLDIGNMENYDKAQRDAASFTDGDKNA